METYIKAVAPSAPSRSTATLIKTGQTTSYRTGDDGDLEAGRNVSFTVLAENNVFGNTNRFTDELGTQLYLTNIVIDWSTYNGSTVLGWRRTTTSGQTWNQAIDGALLTSIAPFTTGWRLPNFMELLSLANFQIVGFLNYSPFNLSSVNLWTSTTTAGSTSGAFMLSLAGNNINSNFGKANATWYIPCRTFTVIGTTLS
jgi:hypothetical protein